MVHGAEEQHPGHVEGGRNKQGRARSVAVADPSGDRRKEGAGDAAEDLSEDDGSDAPGEVGLEEDEDDGEGLADEIGGEPEDGANSDHDPGVVVLLPQVVHPVRRVDIQTESLSITRNQDGSLCAGLEVVGKAGRTTGMRYWGIVTTLGSGGNLT